ncbi:MAG: hypothetical protein ACO2PN_14355 [Pyrobaculum sp.]
MIVFIKSLSQWDRRIDEEARNNANNEKLLNACASKLHLRLAAPLSVLLVLGVFLHNAADVGIHLGRFSQQPPRPIFEVPGIVRRLSSTNSSEESCGYAMYHPLSWATSSP